MENFRSKDRTLRTLWRVLKQTPKGQARIWVNLSGKRTEDAPAITVFSCASVDEWRLFYWNG